MCDMIYSSCINSYTFKRSISTVENPRILDEVEQIRALAADQEAIHRGLKVANIFGVFAKVATAFARL